MRKAFITIIILMSLLVTLVYPVSSASVPKYDSVCIGSNQNVFPVKKNNKWGVINTDNKLIVPFKYDEVKVLNDGALSVLLNGKYGVVNAEGKQIIDTKYDRVFNFYDGCYSTIRENKTICFDSIGNLLNDKYPGYENYVVLSSKYIAVGKLGSDNLTVSWGIIDNSTGKEIIKPNYPSKVEGYTIPPVLINENGLFGLIQNDVKGNMLGGIVDRDGKIVLPFEYKCFSQPPGIVGFCPYFSDGLSLVQHAQTGKTSYIDRNGKIVFTLGKTQPVTFFTTELKYQPFNFSDGMCKVISSAKIDIDNNIAYTGKWGFIDKKGKLVAGMQYDTVSDFYNGYAAVKKNGKMGFINKQGKVVIPIKYQYDDRLFYLDNMSYIKSRITANMVSVGLKGNYGVVDYSGKTIVPFSYKEPLIYSGEAKLFKANKSGKYGFVNKKNQVVIPFKYQSVTDFTNNVSIVGYTNHFGVINKAGKVVIPTTYDSIEWVFGNKLRANKGGQWDFFDATGKTLFTASEIQY